MKHSRHAIAMLVAKYRAVVQKIWWKNFSANNLSLVRCKKGACAAALLLSLTISPGLAAAGEIVNYTGDISDPHLQTLNGAPNSLGPSDLTNTTYNIITINYASGNNPAGVFGAYTNSGDATNNTVDFLSGTATYLVVGGNSQNGAGDYNTVNVSGNSNLTDSAVGGTSVNSTANYNTVNISGNPDLTAALLRGGKPG